MMTLGEAFTDRSSFRFENCPAEWWTWSIIARNHGRPGLVGYLEHLLDSTTRVLEQEAMASMKGRAT